MNQWVTIAKITGGSAAAISAIFREWSHQRKLSPDEPTLVEPEQWLTESRHEMTRFAEDLREHVTEPPVVFYTEFVDMWSMGDMFCCGFPRNGNPLYSVEAGIGCSL